MNNRQLILEAEAELKKAMIDSDVIKLSELLSDDLVFISHLGHVFTKNDDLAAHKEGFVKIEKIEVLENQLIERNNTVVVSLLTSVAGSFGGVSSEENLRFMRVWNRELDGKWKVIAAQSTLSQETV